eukprot:CAMPEP_0176484994 /NCGR_PEP_ID=MMETSP0200_2-20121128/4807_1 /TAXON_ID=947934 /ORGANISM="Chaetoceros sp., Strain GSL56" /LENGTH=246 /DNA_ID=CAMNT_0017881617 /DNA_START=68 /DNA_END=808 /DNA_ORIENTATION=-
MVKSNQKTDIPIPKKVIHVKKRVSSVLSTKSTKAPTNLFGIECEGGVFVAWLEKSGPMKEAAYILPFTTAYDKTVNDQQPVDLYPDGLPNTGSMLDLWKIDYIMNRREPTREHSNSILFSEGYPFKCFVWLRLDEGSNANMTLDHWLHNLSEQMMTFAAFTSKNDNLYGKFKWGLNIRIIVEKTVHYAAQDLLDGDVLRIIRDSYDTHILEELLIHDTIRCMYFGPERSVKSLLDFAKEHHDADNE